MRAGFTYGRYALGRRTHGYVVTWRDEGSKRRCYRLGETVEAKARAALIAFATAHAKASAATAVTVGDIMARYIADRAHDGKSTSKQVVSWKALAPYFAALEPMAIDKALCRRYRADREAAGRRVGTVCTDLSVLRAALNYGVRSHLIARAPHVWLPPQPAPKDVRLTREEAERLIAGTWAPHVRLFVILGLATAARSGALLGLTWDRVDFERGVIHLADPGRARTAKARPTVPMNASVRSALSEARAGALSPYVIEWNGKRVASIKTAFRKASARSGIRQATPHVLRHTAASWMAEDGVPMDVIAQYLGHSNPAITARVYARFSPDYLRDAARSVEVGMMRRRA